MTTHQTLLRVSCILVVSACGSPHDRHPRSSSAPSVVTSDVHNFVGVLDQLNLSDSTCRGLDRYFAQASAGLSAYRDKYDMGRTDLCHSIRAHPKRYAVLQTKLPGIDSAQQSIEGAFAKFATLSPGAMLPSVYFVVGDGISGGTTTGGRAPIVLIGAELLGSSKGLPVLTVHELIHTQQHYPTFSILTGGPSFLRGTVLAQSIKEGSADFLAELVTGQVAAPDRDKYGDVHELEIWRDFRNDMHGKDYSRWIYNGRGLEALTGRPSDLGYYVGYRITKAYYDKATDKRTAVGEILTIRDFDDFLRKSGYAGQHI